MGENFLRMKIGRSFSMIVESLLEVEIPWELYLGIFFWKQWKSISRIFDETILCFGDLFEIFSKNMDEVDSDLIEDNHEDIEDDDPEDGDDLDGEDVFLEEENEITKG